MRQSGRRFLRQATVLFNVLMPALLSAAERPNVVTIFIDDMGWSDLSCFNGHAAETPNIDQLAQEGLRFTNFYVNSPICSPSRVALSTGQYPQRWQISSYLAARRLNQKRGMAQWLDLKAPMISRQLQQSGYATGHFGKWHMGGQRDVGEAPLITEYGFDKSLTNFEGLGPRVLPLKDAYDGRPPQKHDLGSASLGRGPIRWQDRSVVTAEFVSDALTFIEQSQRQQKPFFVNVWPDDVHSPFFPPKQLRDRTDKSKRALYYAVLEEMDRQLGRLFDHIRSDPQLRQNTLILVMSDNGHEEGAGSSDPLRGAKTWLYEGGVRSPLIVWGPGLVEQDAVGSTNDSSVLCALDVNRSLYTLTRTPMPPDADSDGEDLASTLLGRRDQSRTAPIFWRRPPDRPGTRQNDNPDLAVRHKQWKYYVNYDGSHAQLFNLETDISEARNVAGENPEVSARLHNQLVEWNAAMPVDAGDPNWSGRTTAAVIPADRFVNPIGEGADPWVIADPNQQRYLWCLSDGNRAIAVHSSDRLTSLGRKHIVWSAPESGPLSREIWAPELHFLDGRWHIYFAASDGRNENHLTYVLKSRSADPLGKYDCHGPMATGEGIDAVSPNIWAIDMTVLELRGKRYALWSGWDAPGTDRQYLYIARMASPTQLVGPRVQLCGNDDYLWERTQPDPSKRGLNEGPQVFQANGNTCIVYSCGASWLPTYKLGVLKFVGDDPMNPAAWKKQPEPIFAGTEWVYGTGHSCFVNSFRDEQWWHVFHAKRDRNPGWRRAIHVLPMHVGNQGLPRFELPKKPGEVLDRPSGESSGTTALPVTLFGRGTDTSNWSYYGHHQFMNVDNTSLHLGRVPAEPINDYRCGEKIVLEQLVPADVSVSVAIDFSGNQAARDAGILFRCSGASVGYDAQRGYFAGLIPATGRVILGRTDGDNWVEIARAPTQIDVTEPQTLTVQVSDKSITVSHNGREKISAIDGTYDSGTVGLRVVNTHAVFSGLTVQHVQ